MIAAMSKEGSKFTGVAIDLADENALLRASLAETRDRLEELEQSTDFDVLTDLPNRRRSRASRPGVGQASVTARPRLALDDLRAWRINERHGGWPGTPPSFTLLVYSPPVRSTDLLAGRGGQFGLILDHSSEQRDRTAERLTLHRRRPLDLGGRESP